MDLSGRTLGEFRLRTLIDEGGYGQVYLAEQPALEREVVVKVLREDRGSPGSRERFLREARLAAQLRHPYAAQVYASGAAFGGSLLWIATEAEDRDRGTKRDHVSALAQICRQLGGRLAIVSQRTLNDLFNRDWPDEGDEDSDDFDLEHHEGFSPTAEDNMLHGLNWREKIVYAVRGREKVASIIHEMGHVFVDRYPPDSSRCREWRWFGWEMAIARQIGAWETWSRQNARYGIGDAEWGELSTKRRQAVITDRVRYAKRIGILGETGEPRSIR